MNRSRRPNAHSSRTPHPLAGFALVEVLVACVLLATGLVALAAMHPQLSRSADLARQRSEAVRLAQTQMENLRVVTQFDASAGNDTHSSNTTYTRSWRLDTTLTRTLKTVAVDVDWNDRTEQSHRVSLRTVLWRDDPSWSGGLTHAPDLAHAWQRPHDRHLQIPLPAVSLGAGRSVLRVDNSLAVVLDDSTGEIVMVCDAAVTNLAALAAHCQMASGLLLTGHITRSEPGLPWPTGVDISGLAGLADSPPSTCRLGDAVDPATGAALPDHKRYVCLLFPSNADAGWSGRLRLAGVPTDGDHLVCRIELTARELDNNQRNAQDYRAVKAHLSAQNHLLHRSAAGTCPDAGADDHQLVLHQDCRASDPSRAASQCPAMAVRSGA